MSIKKTTRTPQQLLRTRSFMSPAVLASCTVVVLSGIYIVFRLFAASSLGLEAERGSGLTSRTDAAASGGQYILFAAPSPNPPHVTPPPPPTLPPPPPATDLSTANLDEPHKKDIAMQLVSSAENSSLNWKSQYTYIEDIGDGRGYTGGIIGFTSGTHDMLELVQYYTQIKPSNILAKYIPALKSVDGSASHNGLGTAYVNDWHTAAADSVFIQAQNDERDRVYFNPSVNQAKTDGLHALGQFIYYDAIVMHGPGNDSVSFGGIRATALRKATPPSQDGNETTYLNAFLDARKAAMLTEAAHDDTSRVDTEQRTFLSAGNLYLNPTLTWKTYGDPYSIKAYPSL